MSLLALQRGPGNRAIVSALQTGPPIVQRASRDGQLAALRSAIRAGEWQEVATRLNGFNDPDIVRLSASLTVGEAANTRAAAATHLAGWPQEKAIISALDRGRSEVARIGKIYQAYEQSVRAADWPGTVRQLHAMSEPDIDDRLRKLPSESLRAVCAAAPESSTRVTPLAISTAKAKGINTPEGLGPLTIGNRDLGATRQYLPGGEMLVNVTAPVAQGDGAAIGLRRIADGLVTLAGVVPLSAIVPAPAAPAGVTALESGVYEIVTGTGTVASAGGGASASLVVPAVASGTSLAVRIPVVGVAFVVGLVGPFAAGWAIAHAAEVAKASGEFGPGTSAPGGAPLSGATLPGAQPAPAPGKHQDPDDGCRDCPPGTTPIYGWLDSLGRATSARATLRGRTWSGSKPAEDPAGFQSGVSGKFGGQHRAHLLARTLGGSGGPENLVPFGALENIAMYHNAELEVETHITFAPNNCVQFIATPIYEGTILSPTAIHLFAEDLCTGWVFDQIVPNRTFH